MEANETELLQRYVSLGDEQAFTQLVDKHVKIAYSAAIATLGREDLGRVDK